MAYFDKDFNSFLRELAGNNNKDWFDQNRKRYEKSVKEPFKAFVQAVIERMDVDIQPKDAIFRINRDIRFSADKTPYKTKLSAIVSKGGKKDKTTPGLYLELGPEDCRVYSGVHNLEKDQLQGIRELIAKNMSAFNKLITDKKFTEKFGEIHGEKAKRLPKELQEAAEKQPLIYNKNFYYFAKFKPTLTTDPKIIDTIMEYYDAGKDVSKFLAKGL